MSLNTGQSGGHLALQGAMQRPPSPFDRLVSAPHWRASTTASNVEAVERVILAMHDRMGTPLALDDMASIALMSPFHFNRVFRQITGLPPCKFLAALRVQMAKRLLLTSRMSVTELCYEVGYNSLGTFITHFTELVGVSPRRLRGLAATGISPCVASAGEGRPDLMPGAISAPCLTGKIRAPRPFAGPAFLGLFTTPIPQGQPVRCAVLSGSDEYQVTSVPEGQYYLFAAAFDDWRDPLACLLADTDLQGRGGPILVSGGQVTGATVVTLRNPWLTDPPILAALPVLLNRVSASFLQ